MTSQFCCQRDQDGRLLLGQQQHSTQTFSQYTTASALRVRYQQKKGQVRHQQSSSIRFTQFQIPDEPVVIVLQLVMDLVIMEGPKDRIRSRLVGFNSLVNVNLRTPYRIRTMIHELIEPATIQFHTDDGLYKIVQDMMQLQMTSHVKKDPQMYQIHPHILNPLTRSAATCSL